MADVLTQRELDDYRGRADRFIAALNEEYYLHYAGLKDSLDLEPIYDEFAELTSLEQANRIGAAVDGDRRIRELWRFACQGYLGNLTRQHEERSAEIEAGLKATVDGEEIPYRMIRPTIANEPDRDKRQRLEYARNALTDQSAVLFAGFIVTAFCYFAAALVFPDDLEGRTDLDDYFAQEKAKVIGALLAANTLAFGLRPAAMGWASWSYIEWWGWILLAMLYVAGIAAILTKRRNVAIACLAVLVTIDLLDPVESILVLN